MAALEFPTSPTDGQVYGNWIWSDAKDAWQAKPITPAVTATSDTAPLNPKDGDQWLNTVDGCLYIYYVDIDGGQWVQVKNNAALSSTIGPRVDALDASGNTNYIINGAFEINQRNLTSTTAGGYGFDRWYCTSTSGSATTTYSSQAFSLGSAPVAGYEATNFARVITSGHAGVNDLAYLSQGVESVRTLAGQTATISFWAKAGSGTPKISVEANQWFGGAAGEVNLSAGYVTLNTSWNRYTITTTIPGISGKTIQSNNDMLKIIFWLSAGSTYSARSGAIGIQNNTFDIWGVQLQAGSVATSFHRSAPTLQAEFAACQRYYEKVMHPGVAGLVRGYGVSGQEWCDIKFFSVTKRVAPTITGGSFGGNVPTLDAITEMSYRVVFTPSATGMWYYIANSGVYASAEL